MKSKKKRRIIDGFMILLLIIGIGAFAYPFVSDALNNYLDQKQAKKTPKKWLNFKKKWKRKTMN